MDQDVTVTERKPYGEPATGIPMQQYRQRAKVRRAEAVTLRLAGWDYDSIAEQTGYASGDTAYQAIREELARRVSAPAEELRQQELARLDRYLQKLDDAVDAGNQGAIQTALRVQERRAKLLGLDAPQDIRVVHEEARRLSIELGLPLQDVLREAEAIARTSRQGVIALPASTQAENT